MARNRKYQPATVRFGPALKVLLLCSFIVGSGVGYVRQKEQLVGLGRRKAELERRLIAVRAQSSQLQGKLMELQSPKVLETRVMELNLGLRMAQANQIVPLAEPAPFARPVPLAPLQYARQERGPNPDHPVRR